MATVAEQIKVQQQLINVLVELFTGKQNAVYESPLDPTAAPTEDALLETTQSFISLATGTNTHLTQTNAKLDALIAALAKHGVDLITKLGDTNTSLRQTLTTNSEARTTSNVALNKLLVDGQAKNNSDMVTALTAFNETHMTKLDEHSLALVEKIQSTTDSMIERFKTNSEHLMLALTGLAGGSDYETILKDLDVTDKAAIDEALNSASFMYIMLNASGDYREENDPFFSNPIVKAIREIGARFDYMDAKSSVVVGAVTSGQGVPSNIDEMLPSPLRNAINKAKQNAIDSIG